MNAKETVGSKPEPVAPSRKALEEAVAAIPSCALTDEGLRSQHERMQQLGPSVKDLHRGEDRVTIEFKPGFDRQLLDETVAVEQECCPFFRFHFDEPARQLTVSVDDHEHRAGLDALAYALSLPRRSHVSSPSKPSTIRSARTSS